MLLLIIHISEEKDLNEGVISTVINSKINEKSVFADLNNFVEQLIPKSEQLHSEFLRISTHLNASDQIMRYEYDIMQKVEKRLDKIHDEQQTMGSDLKFYASQIDEMEKLLDNFQSKIDELPEEDKRIYSIQQREQYHDKLKEVIEQSDVLKTELENDAKMLLLSTSESSNTKTGQISRLNYMHENLLINLEKKLDLLLKNS